MIFLHKKRGLVDQTRGKCKPKLTLFLLLFLLTYASIFHDFPEAQVKKARDQNSSRSFAKPGTKGKKHNHNNNNSMNPNNVPIHPIKREKQMHCFPKISQMLKFQGLLRPKRPWFSIQNNFFGSKRIKTDPPTTRTRYEHRLTS